MNLLKPKTLEEKIFRILGQGAVKTTALLDKLALVGTRPTKQGLYSALRKLKGDDIVIVYRGTAALNVTWLKQLIEVLNRSLEASGGETSDIFALADKESVAYRFGTLRQLDNFWGHTQDIVVRATPSSEPVYTYDPHYWFYLARPEIEKAHITMANDLGKQFLMTVGGTAPLDIMIKKEFENDMRQYHTEQLFTSNTYYVVVIGDYVFESHFDEPTTHRIEMLYARYTTLTDEALKEFRELPQIKTRVRLKISRNHTRANKLKKRLRKNFLITQT